MLVSRRAFIGGLSVAALGGLARGQASPRVDAAVLRQRLEELSVFGRPAGGTFASGVSRVAYSEADIAGRAYVAKLMAAARLQVRVDAAGNIYGFRQGTDASAPPILFGSHIDSVPSGGNFDGDLGSLAALGVMETLDRSGIRTRHPLEMVVWSAEEGVAFGRGLAGSRIVAGDIAPKDLEQVWSGMTRADAIRRIGGAPDRIADAVRAKGSLHGYFELHIEQGGTLEKAGIPIGVVEGIVSIQRYRATITGFANHAGTTPMAERQDALVAAGMIPIIVREVVTSRAGRQVGTVGHFEVSPNAPNVIPGSVTLTIELRDLSPDLLVKMADEIRARIASLAAGSKTAIDIASLGGNPPALAAAEMQKVIERASATTGLATTRLPSGAGHDAQMMAQLCPMGMIFVPSIRGISHSPRELTRWEDCANGANVLLNAVLQLDKN
jgi:N-carbamoyl-L-amino-acid hydrolase